jgi:hypothetical protein
MGNTCTEINIHSGHKLRPPDNDGGGGKLVGALHPPPSEKVKEREQ